MKAGGGYMRLCFHSPPPKINLNKPDKNSFSMENELLYKEIRVDIHGHNQWKGMYVWALLLLNVGKFIVQLKIQNNKPMSCTSS